LDFKCGTDRILEPLVFGDYPEVMRKNVGSRLPHFNKNQSERIKGSLNFIGINHYYSLYVNDRPLGEGVRDYTADMSVYSRGTYGFLYSEVSSHS
jgi:beta-glucosidase